MIQLNRHQEKALNRIQRFLDSDKRIFILKGYAGTGKTTLIQHLVTHLERQLKSFQVMAPTGRAAKILRDKTKNQQNNKDGYGTTIHKAIYNYEDVKILEDEEKSSEGLSYKFYFPIKKVEKAKHLVIVDEASMVSERENKQELYQSGTDCLLPDLLTYIGQSKSNKILFIGDPAQLPPVGENESKALSQSYFSEIGLSHDSYEMTDVIRQGSTSTILINSVKIRDLLHKVKNERNSLQFDYANDFVKVNELDLISEYLKYNPKPGLDNGVIINFKNRDCLSYNREIRKCYFPGKESIQSGDVLLNTKNVYGTFGAYIYNGDLVQVESVEDETQSQSAKIYVEEEGRKVKKLFSFRFRTISIITPDQSDPIPVKIIESMLEESEGALSTDQMKALFVNFNIRFEEEQKIRKQSGLLHYKRGSEVYKEMLNSDPFFNAMHVKYGYSITCHKAQGGEWGTAYVNFKGKVGLSNDHLRWSYTALTRGKEKLYALNPPDTTTFSKITFNTISPLKKLPSEAFEYGEPLETPFHNIDKHPAKRQTFFDLKEKLNDTPYSINRVESSDFLEMYYIQTEEGEVRVDAGHDKAGVFKPFKAPNQGGQFDDLIRLMNTESKRVFEYNYSPSDENFQKLYKKVHSCCAQHDVSIMSVIEKPESYYIIYYLSLHGTYAAVQFNFKANGQFTTANPRIMDMRKRDTLLKLIDCFQ